MYRNFAYLLSENQLISSLDETWIGVYTAKDCYPVQETFIRNYTVVLSTRFFDVQLGIKDPSVFTPPSTCQRAQPEKMSENCSWWTCWDRNNPWLLVTLSGNGLETGLVGCSSSMEIQTILSGWTLMWVFLNIWIWLPFHFQWKTRGSLNWLAGTLCTLPMPVWDCPFCARVCSLCSRVGRVDGRYMKFASAGMNVLLLSFQPEGYNKM